MAPTRPGVNPDSEDNDREYSSTYMIVDDDAEGEAEDADYIPPDDDEDEDNQIVNDEDEDEDEDEGPTLSGAPSGRVLSALFDTQDDGGGVSGTTRRSALLALLAQYRQLEGVRSRTRPRRDDSDDDDPAGWSSRKCGYKDSTIPREEGKEHLRGGEFGRIQPALVDRGRKPSVTHLVKDRFSKIRKVYKDDFARDFIPNTNGTIVAKYQSKAYVGQFSADSSFYYTCCQDFDLHIYDTAAPILPRSAGPYPRQHTHNTTMKLIRTVHGMVGQWTITDSHINPDNSALIYSSLGPSVYMVKLNEGSDEQIGIHLATPGRHYGWYDDRLAIYSCRFSTDGKEIIAGGSRGALCVYDLGAMRRTLSIDAHQDDINSCCWADTSSGNVLVSASDDTSLKVWDRRSLGSSNKPSGVLIGHTEGITHVGPKGDGRYVISNGKDQVLRLWDLRKMRTHQEWTGTNRYSHSSFDYRYPPFPKPAHPKHPLDTSVMQYKGHSVLRTLIRCHFSPAETTGSSYIYSGSYDGLIHIWSLDGSVVQVLDRSQSESITSHPSAPDQHWGEAQQNQYCVRDVSWHSYEPVMMSCAWEGEASSIARHEWKGFGKHGMTLEDVVEKGRAEQPRSSRVTSRHW